MAVQAHAEQEQQTHVAGPSITGIRSDAEAIARIASVMGRGEILATEQVARDLADYTFPAWQALPEKRRRAFIARAQKLLLSMSGAAGIPVYSDTIIVADPDDPSCKARPREVWAWYSRDVTRPGVCLGRLGMRIPHSDYDHKGN